MSQNFERSDALATRGDEGSGVSVVETFGTDWGVD